jgi:flagellar biogenesis protein FliO
MKTSRPKTTNTANGHALPCTIVADEVSLSTLRSQRGLLSRAWNWIQARQVARSSARRLRVAETVSLGEKRFVAVVQVDGRHFLLAGGPTNIALLAQLDDEEDFGDVLKKTMTVGGKPARKRITKQAATAREPANIALLKQPNRTKASSKNKARKPSSEQTRQNVVPGVPGDEPLTAPLYVKETFGDLLQRTMTGAFGRPPKANGKQDNRETTRQMGQYA